MANKQERALAPRPRLRQVVIWGYVFTWCSLLMLQPGLVEAAAQAEVAYARGILAYERGNYEEALTHFRATVASEPENFDAQFYLGLSLSRLGQFKQAAQAFDQALQLAQIQQRTPSPTYVYYHLGLALYAVEDYRRARLAFQEVVDQAPEPAMVRDALHNLNVIQGREYELRPVQLQGMIGFQYDDNVILEPEDDAFAFGKQADGRTIFTFDGQLLTVPTPQWRLGAAYRLFQSVHFNLSEFDIQEHTVQLFTRLKVAPVTFRVAADYTFTLLDNTRFSEAFTIQPSALIQQTKNLFGVVSVRYRTSNFFDQFIFLGQGAVRDRDGWTVRPGFDQYLTFNKGRSHVRLSYYYEGSRTDGTDWEYNGHHVGLGLQTPLWWGITLHVDGVYRRRDYLHINSFDADTRGILTPADRRERVDNRFAASVALERALGRHLMLSAGFLHISNLSNIDFFDYRRNIVTVSFTGKY